MDRKYSCPKCAALLNPDHAIILLGRHGGSEGLLAFNPEPGNYEVAIPGHVTINKGDLWDFYCPVCHENLIFTGEENMASLDMMDGVGNWYRVVFSRIAGEQVTFVVPRDPHCEVEEYGVDFARYESCLWNRFY